MAEWFIHIVQIQRRNGKTKRGRRKNKKDKNGRGKM
jgi:hypothetical protein